MLNSFSKYSKISEGDRQDIYLHNFTILYEKQTVLRVPREAYASMAENG